MKETNKRYIETLLVFAFEILFLFLTIYPLNYFEQHGRHVQYSCTMICQGLLEKCCSAWSTQCVQQKMSYWSNGIIQSSTTFQITRIVFFLSYLWIAIIVLLLFYRQSKIVKKQSLSIRTSYFIAAFSVIGALVITNHVTKPFDSIPLSIPVMTMELTVAPALLISAGMVAAWTIRLW